MTAESPLQQMTPTDRLALGAVFLLLLLAYLPLLGQLIDTWLQADDHSHGLLILPLALAMVWSRRAELVRSEVHGSWFGGAVLVVALLLYLLGWLGGIRTLAALSLPLAVTALVALLLGPEVLRQAAYPLAFLVFLVPVPAQLYARVTGPLQLVVSKAAAAVLSAGGVPVYRVGNMIHHPQQVFEVVQACSGLRSMMTMLILGAVLGFYRLRTPVGRLLLLLAAVPIAVVVNIGRVTALVAAWDLAGWDLAAGMAHTLLGLAVFAVALGLFLLLLLGVTRCER